MFLVRVPFTCDLYRWHPRPAGMGWEMFKRTVSGMGKTTRQYISSSLFLPPLQSSHVVILSLLPAASSAFVEQHHPIRAEPQWYLRQQRLSLCTESLRRPHGRSCIGGRYSKCRPARCTRAERLGRCARICAFSCGSANISMPSDAATEPDQDAAQLVCYSTEIPDCEAGCIVTSRDAIPPKK